ncbi:hypothetical protein [Streptomyces sp. NPDC048248]|uniref:hypothetical protein n=1 Tax=Streptomyces sp. NPDC048248 TaxID=3365523 RepID=UPI00371F8FC4
MTSNRKIKKQGRRQLIESLDRMNRNSDGDPITARRSRSIDQVAEATLTAFLRDHPDQGDPEIRERLLRKWGR